MSLETPTTSEIADNLISQMESTLNQTVPMLPKSFMRVLSKATAAVFITLYKYSGFIFLQMFVQTASFTTTIVNGKVVNPLTNWGLLIGVGYPQNAVATQLVIDVTVDLQTGTLPANTPLISQLNGVTYLTVGAVPLNASVVQATVVASADSSGGNGSGTIGNLDDGAELTFANPIVQVQKTATVASTSVTGAAAETSDAYRKRIIDRFQKRPQGGAPADFQIWGVDVEGIVNVWPYKDETNPGIVKCYVEATPASSGSPDGIPTNAQLQQVLDSIDYDENGVSTRRPISSLANAFPIVRTGFQVEVVGTQVDDLGTVQGLVETACEQYFLDREPFVFGLSVPPRKDRISTAELAGQISTIISAYNGYFEGLNIKIGATEYQLYQLGAGEKSKVTNVVFL